MIRLAAMGIASTGKSALLNAVFGTSFPVDPRSNSTLTTVHARVNFRGRELEIIDTPPLGAIVPADAYLLVCDKDLTDIEYLQATRVERPVAVAVNKSDLFSAPQSRQLLQSIKRRLDGIIPPRRVVLCAADPVRFTHRRGKTGDLIETHTKLPADVGVLLPVLDDILLEAERSLRVRIRKLAAQIKQLTR